MSQELCKELASSLLSDLNDTIETICGGPFLRVQIEEGNLIIEDFTKEMLDEIGSGQAKSDDYELIITGMTIRFNKREKKEIETAELEKVRSRVGMLPVKNGLEKRILL